MSSYDNGYHGSHDGSFEAEVGYQRRQNEERMKQELADNVKYERMANNRNGVHAQRIKVQPQVWLPILDEWVAKIPKRVTYSLMVLGAIVGLIISVQVNLTVWPLACVSALGAFAGYIIIDVLVVSTRLVYGVLILMAFCAVIVGLYYLISIFV